MDRAARNLESAAKNAENEAKKVSPQQWLMYAGAAGSAAAAAALTLSPKDAERVYSLDTPTLTGSVGRKFRHLTALHMAGASAMQALVAYEKPTPRMLALNGGIWTAGAVTTGVHTFHTKSIKQETGAALAATQLLVGGAMIGRAIYMDRNEILSGKIL